MGYSISVKFQTQAERDAMRQFLAEHEAELAGVIDGVHGGMVSAEDLAYPPPGKIDHTLGFNATRMPFGAWALCAWMARRSSFKSQGKAVLYYDEERYEVLAPGEDGRHGEDVLVDEHDVMIVREPPGKLAMLARLLDPIDDKKQAQRVVRGINAAWSQRGISVNHRPRP